MTGLQPVKGAYRLYVKNISPEGFQGVFPRMAPALLLAMVMAREEAVFVTEVVKLKNSGGEEIELSRIYFFGKGAQVPELMERPADERPARTNGRALEVDV
jgi:hypothetical protein